MHDKEIKWSAPEFPYYEKSLLWHVGVGIVAIAVIVIALFQKNFLFAVFALVGGGLVMFWGHREPATLEFTLSEKGLDIHTRKFYPFEGLTGFAIVEDDEESDIDELVLRTKSALNSYLKLTIPRDHREKIKTFLARFLPEMEYRTTITDQLTRLFRF